MFSFDWPAAGVAGVGDGPCADPWVTGAVTLDRRDAALAEDKFAVLLRRALSALNTVIWSWAIPRRLPASTTFFSFESDIPTP